MPETMRQHALRLLGAYLDEVDHLISRRMLRCVVPYETTLTDEFVALLDSGSRDKTDGTAPVDVLQKQLAALTKKAKPSEQQQDPPISFTLSATSHNGRYESEISSADIGLVFDAKAGDARVRRTSFILQAKKMYIDRDHAGVVPISVGSGFKAHCEDQAKRLQIYR